MLDREMIPKKTPGVQIETFGDGVLLYREAAREAAYLNNSAAVIWALCDGNNSLGDIEDTLVKAYPDEKGSILQDIESTLEKLMQNDAIEF